MIPNMNLLNKICMLAVKMYLTAEIFICTSTDHHNGYEKLSSQQQSIAWHLLWKFEQNMKQKLSWMFHESSKGKVHWGQPQVGRGHGGGVGGSRRGGRGMH